MDIVKTSYISTILETMLAAPLSGWSIVCGFSQGHEGASTEMIAGRGAAFASRAWSEQNSVAASSIPTIILEVLSLFMLVGLRACPPVSRRANVRIKLQPALALVNRMNV
jgi:hypothetical protein